MTQAARKAFLPSYDYLRGNACINVSSGVFLLTISIPLDVVKYTDYARISK